MRKLPILAGMLACAAAIPAHAAPSVVASLTQPPGGLACSEAANQAHVVFDFKTPESDVRKFSVFVDGKGLPESAISEEWPRVTVLNGLHPGRNKVEVYATGEDGRTEAHTLTVLVGEAPSRGDKEDVAVVDCVGGNRSATGDRSKEEVIARASDDTDEVIEDVRPHVDDDVDEVDDVVYEDAPVYVYHPYPVFGVVSYYPAYYYPWPYYYGYYGYRSYPYYSGAHGYYYGGRPGYYRGGHGSAGAYWGGFNRSPRGSSGSARAAPSSRGGGGGGGHRGRH